MSERPPSRSPCAVCWIDARTGARGTNETTWICWSCRHSPANVDWVITPPWEVYGVLTVDGEIDPDAPMVEEDWPAEIEAPSGPYETKLCIEIMRRWCLGESQRGIARALETSRRYVDDTVAFWKDNRSEFLKSLVELLAGGPRLQAS